MAADLPEVRTSESTDAYKLGGTSISRERAALTVRFACELLGLDFLPSGVVQLALPMRVEEFGRALTRRYGTLYPNLVYRTESSLERARLERRPEWGLPKIILLQGAPKRLPGR